MGKDNDKPNATLAKDSTSESQLYKLAPILGLLGLFFLFAAVVIYILFGHVSGYFFSILGLGVFLIILFVIVRLSQIRDVLITRQAVYGTNVFIIAGVAIGIVIVINVISANVLDKQIDLTESKIFSLSPQSKKILRSLDKPVKVIAFFPTDNTNQTLARQRAGAKDLLNIYRHESNKIKVEFLDPDTAPMKAKEYKIEYPGTIVFESGGRHESVTVVSEQRFTSAILRVTEEKAKKIYFLRGHKERAIDEYAEKTGLSNAADALKAQNYIVKDLYLTTQPEVPKDCAALIIPDPKLPFDDKEIDAIDRYLEADGKLMVMFDLPEPGKKEDRKLIDLVEKWGVTVGDDLVIDRNMMANYFGNISIPYVQQFNYHQITKGVPPIPFFLARSVSPSKNKPENLTVTILAQTTDKEGVSWGETKRDKKDNKWVVDDGYTKGVDIPAPVSLAVAVQRESKPNKSENRPSLERSTKPEENNTRLVVTGDADFASNDLFNRTGGGDFFLNAVNWLTAEEELISIRAKPPKARYLRSLSGTEERVVALTSIFAMPICVFILGIVVWFFRREH